MQFLRSVCYNSFQVPHCLIRFFTNRPKSVILFYSEVFFSQPSFSEFLIFELYKKLLSMLPATADKALGRAHEPDQRERYHCPKGSPQSLLCGESRSKGVSVVFAIGGNEGKRTLRRRGWWVSAPFGSRTCTFTFRVAGSSAPVSGNLNPFL